MITWSRTRTFGAGVALILAANAVALVGVAYNRSGDQESTLTLTQRELSLPFYWEPNDENSGLALQLRWRVRIGKEKNSGSGTSYPGAHGTPDWLDKAKLMELGFDVSKAENIPEDRAYYAKLLPKEMLLVLELDGPAYREALEHARQHWQKQEALRAANVGKKEFEQRAKRAREQLDRDEPDNTRLFVIDAGLDATALRTRYPDRTRYAIVRGHVQPQAGGKTGYVSGISIDEIHVPFTYRQVFEPMLRDVKRTQYGTSWPDKGYKVSVVYGKRFEPWITGVSLSSRAPLK